MKTSAVIILVIGAVSLVGGVVALTLPYTGYPWLRHSVFLQAVGVSGIVVGLFISLYYLSNRDKGTRNQYGTKRKHSKTFEKYPDYLGKDNLAGPHHPPVQIFTISEKEDASKSPVYSGTDKHQVHTHQRYPPSKVSSNILDPRIQPVSSKPALSSISSTISMRTSNSAGSQHSHPQSSKKRVRNRNVRKVEKAGKPRKAKGCKFFKRKSATGNSNNGQDRSLKHSMSTRTPGISGVFSSLKKQAKNNLVIQTKDNSSVFTNKQHSHELTGLENLAGPQYEPEEEGNIFTSEQRPDLQTHITNESKECRVQASEKKVPPNERTESAIQRKVSLKLNNKAAAKGQKLVRQKSKTRINLHVPENTDGQNINQKPVERKRGSPYLFNWKKKRRNLKPKAEKKIKKVTLFGTGTSISPAQRLQEDVGTGAILQPNNCNRDHLESQHFSNLKSNQLLTSNQTDSFQNFQNQKISTQIISEPEPPQVYAPPTEEIKNKSFSNDKVSIPIFHNCISSVQKTVPEKADKMSNDNQQKETQENNKLSKDQTSNHGFISIKGSGISMEEMKNKFTTKHKNKIGFNFWENKQEVNKGKTKTKKSLASVRKAKHPYEKSPNIPRNNNVYEPQQPQEKIKYQIDENKAEYLGVRSFSKKIEQMNDNLKILSGERSISEPVQEFDKMIGVNLNPGGRKLCQDTAGLGNSTDSLFSARDSLLSFGSSISTGSYNSAGSITNPLRSSLKKVKKKTTCESVLSTGSGYSGASGRKSVRIAVGGEQTTV